MDFRLAFGDVLGDLSVGHVLESVGDVVAVLSGRSWVSLGRCLWNEVGDSFGGACVDFPLDMSLGMLCLCGYLWGSSWACVANSVWWIPRVSSRLVGGMASGLHGACGLLKTACW